ncbi:pentatricopeptide repeat-containing protein [Pyrus ussuriensis x Pyrus communis]|uniref:Pentatricopeptide repeat-containing protein n=1 Tax=Pyrus ussuriensis x Pyrus communis TaxID=2448454 RepID=A0A5N5FAJ7_9ROSA|nr:pentatricopeptide repeat-containing protein [Pyrus ussuriensis x Pyrus communis]
MRKLLESDFSAAVDGAIKDIAAKMRATEDEVLDERTVELGRCEPQGKMGTVGSHGARSTQLGAMVTDQRLPGVVEHVGTIVSAELGLA